jgi:hypothetical protein
MTAISFRVHEKGTGELAITITTTQEIGIIRRGPGLLLNRRQGYHHVLRDPGIRRRPIVAEEDEEKRTCGCIVM